MISKRDVLMMAYRSGCLTNHARGAILFGIVQDDGLNVEQSMTGGPLYKPGFGLTVVAKAHEQSD